MSLKKMTKYVWVGREVYELVRRRLGRPAEPFKARLKVETYE